MLQKIAIFTLLISINSTLGAKELYQSQDLVTDGTFTQGVEGPAVDSQGLLYAVNFGKEGTIGKIDHQGNASLFLTLANGSVGNGIRFDQAGNMYIADYVNHNILKYSPSSDKITVHAHQPKMHQPNDIAIMDSGILFASDPNWAKSNGQLWRVNIDGSTDLLESNMGTTNGVAVNPSQTKLYVNESVQRKVWQYDLNTQGEVSNKTILIEFSDHGLDGMRTDKNGNIYIARYGAGVVAVVSPSGKLIREVKLKGTFPTNVAFGGIDGETVFVTMQKRGAIEYFTNEVAGRNF
jgi:sugar lactone lactonase YvrE